MEKIMKNKETFTIDGTEFAVLRPGPRENREAQKVFNSTFSSVLKNGGLLRESLWKHMKDQGLWDDEMEKKYKTLLNTINDNELILSKGGISLKKARSIAISIKKARNEIQYLLAKRNALDINTAEGQAENAKFNALVAMSLVYNDSGEKVYSNVDEYTENASEEKAYKAASILADMIYGVNDDFESTLPENKFLKEWNFVDEKLRLVDDKKRLIDEDGRLINEYGYLVNEDGKPIDKNGIPLDENGNYLVEKQPFLDDDGNPILNTVVENIEEQDQESIEPQKEDLAVLVEDTATPNQK